MESNPLEKAVDDIKEYQKVMEQAAHQTEDVKNGDCTPEDEMKEPAYILYNSIAETTVQIMQQPLVVDICKKMADKLGEDLAVQMVQLISVAMTNSAHQAILVYDDLLKAELTKQFDLYTKAINDGNAMLRAHDAALKVFKAAINNVAKSNIVEEAEKKIAEQQ